MIRGNTHRYSYGSGQADAFAVWSGRKRVGYALIVDGKWYFYDSDGYQVNDEFGLVEDQRLYESRSGLSGAGRIFVAAPFYWNRVEPIRVDVGLFARLVQGGDIMYSRDFPDFIDIIQHSKEIAVPALIADEWGGRIQKINRKYGPNLGRSCWVYHEPSKVRAIKIGPAKWAIRHYKYKILYAPELEGADEDYVAKELSKVIP